MKRFLPILLFASAAFSATPVMDPDAPPPTPGAISNAEAVFRVRSALEGFFAFHPGYQASEDLFIRIERRDGRIGVRLPFNIPGDRPRTLQNHPLTIWLDEVSGEVVPPPGATFEPMSDDEATALLAEREPALADWLADHPPAIKRTGGLVLVSVPGEADPTSRDEKGSTRSQDDAERTWPGPAHETWTAFEEPDRRFLGWHAKPGHTRPKLDEAEASASLPDGDAFRIALDALADEDLPLPGMHLTCSREPGRTLVAVVTDGSFADDARRFEVVIDDATRAVVRGPTFVDSTNRVPPSVSSDDAGDTNLLRRVSRRLGGLSLGRSPFRAEMRFAPENGKTMVSILANVPHTTDLYTNLVHGSEMARFLHDPERNAIEAVPFAPVHDDAALVRLAKAAIPLRTYSRDCPFLVKRVSGIAIVGFPRRLGWHGTLIFDPVFWFHDESGTLLTGRFEPD